MNYQNEKYAEIGQNIISELFPNLQDVRIAWLSSDKEKKSKGKIVFATCSKVIEKYEWCCPYDFIITVYEPNIEGFTDEQLKILLEHEIMHIGIEGEKNFIVPHDIEEFMDIIKKYGIDWQNKYANDTDFALLD